MNLEIAPHPPLFGNTPFAGPGIVSIQDGFFTFKFIELLTTPMTEGEPTATSSLWTQLYGSAFSLHFESWPETWVNTSEGIFTLSRSIFILALIPTLLLLLGLFIESVGLLRGLIKQEGKKLENLNYGLFSLVFMGYIAFLVLYAYDYRTYSVMKAIFILPSVLGIVVLFLRGIATLYAKCPNQAKWILRIVEGAIIILLFLYMTDVTTMIVQLAHTPSPFQ